MNTLRKLVITCAVVVVLAPMRLIGAAELQTPKLPPAPQQQPEKPVEMDDNYLIGPNDELQISVWLYPELTSTLKVRPDGKISFPQVENMVAIKKTPSRLARDIEAVLDVKGLKDPQVNVVLVSAVSVFSQVKVMGEVRRAVSMPHYKGIRVSDLLQAAGGLTEFAKADGATLVRTVNGKEEKIPLKLGKLQNKGELKYDVELQPGDVLFVPQSKW